MLPIACAPPFSVSCSFSHLAAVAADRAGNKFLTGYIASILDRGLHWERDSYILKIVNGVATITLFKDDPMRQEVTDKQVYKNNRRSGSLSSGRPVPDAY